MLIFILGFAHDIFVALCYTYL